MGGGFLGGEASFFGGMREGERGGAGVLAVCPSHHLLSREQIHSDVRACRVLSFVVRLVGYSTGIIVNSERHQRTFLGPVTAFLR